MCGICGIYGISSESVIKKMADVLHHRGPDEDGYYIDDTISLGSKRLCIIDLVTGNQPIYNKDRTKVIVYNGEVYNYKSIRSELADKGYQFNTNSDTEVVLKAYEEYGIGCLGRFNGNFVFAIYDIKTKKLFIARDRLGIRPLYYSIRGDKIAFGSSIKSIIESGIVEKQLNKSSIDKYLTLRYAWGNDTFFEDIKKLPAGSYITVQDGNIAINKYWNTNYSILRYENKEDYVLEFQRLLEESVKLRMISDVPIGAYLSSGVDSSLIVALMAKYSKSPVETFSVGFDLDIDETTNARNFAKSIGCNFNEIKLDKQSYDLLPEIVSYFDEPIGDSIIIPTYMLNKEASKHLKVVLTGEGADEIFGGYIHQYMMHYGSLYNLLVPEVINNKIMIPALKKSPMAFLDKIFPYPSKLGEQGRTKLLKYIQNINNLSRSYFSIASIFSAAEKEELYSSNFIKELNEIDVESDFSYHLRELDGLSTLNKLIDLDCKYWLCDYTLLKQDRLTMANSIEGRVPYLDHNLVEFVSRIPVRQKLNGLTTKYLLRKAAEAYLPKNIANRPKKAFYYPFQKCFKGDFDMYLKHIFNKNSHLVNMGLIKEESLIAYTNFSTNEELLQSKKLMTLMILELWLRAYL